MNTRLVATDNRLKRFLQRLRKLSPRQLIRPETWKQFWRWLRWNTSLKRRRIKRLMKQLTPLVEQGAPAGARALRDEVFARICLQLRRMEDRRKLLNLLNTANQPIGFEQVFFASIYPQILRRNLAVSPMQTSAKHRLDVEIGYLGHSEDYFFWVFEIDGASSDDQRRKLTPEQKVRGDKLYVVYRLGAAELVEGQSRDALQWMINSQMLFERIVTDLRRRNYKVTAASIPRFAQERLSLLRRLALDALRKRRARS